MKDTSLDLEIKRYIVDVKSYLICDFRTRRRFINDLKNDIACFIDETENATMDDVCRRFGEPRDIAKGFFETADIKKIKKRMNIGRTVTIGVIIALVMWLSALLFVIIHPYVEEPKSYIIEYMHDGDVPDATINETVGE